VVTTALKVREFREDQRNTMIYVTARETVKIREKQLAVLLLNDVEVLHQLVPVSQMNQFLISVCKPCDPVWVPGLRIDPLRLLVGCRKRRLNQAPLNLCGLI